MSINSFVRCCVRALRNFFFYLSFYIEEFNFFKSRTMPFFSQTFNLIKYRTCVPYSTVSNFY